MTTKEYLQQAFLLSEKIKTKQYTLRQLEEMAEGVKSLSTEDRVQVSSTGDVIGKTVPKIADLKKEKEQDVARYIALREEIGQLINLIQDDKLRTVLEKRYLNYKKWYEIAQEMNYHPNYIYELHREAIKKLDNVRES